MFTISYFLNDADQRPRRPTSPYQEIHIGLLYCLRTKGTLVFLETPFNYSKSKQKFKHNCQFSHNFAFSRLGAYFVKIKKVI